MMLSSKGLTKTLTATFGGIVTLLSATVASAQAPAATTAPAAAPAPTPAEPASASVSVGATATPTEATATALAEPPVPPPEPEPMPAPVEPVAAEEVAPVEEAPAEEAPKGTPKLMVFGDAWAGFQSAKSGSPSGGDVYATKGPDGSAQSGFGLSWLGADLGYDAGAWAVNGSQIGRASCRERV